MKKTIVAGFALSLLAGTSAFALERGGGAGDWGGRSAQHRQDQTVRQADRQADRQTERQESRADDQRPARAVPRVSNERAQEAIAAAHARQVEHQAVVEDRRTDRANETVVNTRARQVERREETRRVIVPRVAPPAEQRRTDRRDRNTSQHVIIRQDRDGDRREHRDGDRRQEHRVRPGDGHQLRARDRGRHWYNPDQWRRAYRATHRYRVHSYHRPSGWYVRTWIFGDYLPHGWYHQSYYLDWWRYGLPMPPIGTEWVRVGEDALLVDTWSGEVLSVYYDLFW